MSELTLILLTALFLVREYSAYKERRSWEQERGELLNRIMSSSYTEFRAMENPEDNEFEIESDNLISLEEAESELIQ